MRFAKNPIAALRGTKETSEEFWAVRDVSFEITDGEVIGVIGRNGAGKSTLLKLLSRITDPTRGRIELNGRVASLLEVGTGFHPELTGRENIFLNGAILGMSRAEIRRKFDEIVDFAEIDRFLDTPVKRYSSGMYVRLAFAVAAHLEPEILIVDEVLAVGDAQFQKKCIGKMNSVAEGGRTVLFVSHQMGAVSQLCTRCLYMKSGELVADGETQEIIETYLSDGTGETRVLNRSRKDAGSTTPVWIKNLSTRNEASQPISSFAHDEKIVMEMDFESTAPVLPRGLAISICLQDTLNRRVFTDYRIVDRLIATDPYHIKIALPEGIIAPGNYSFIVSLHTFQSEVFDRLERVCEFSVVDNGTRMSMFRAGDTGCLLADCEWSLPESIVKKEAA